MHLGGIAFIALVSSLAAATVACSWSAARSGTTARDNNNRLIPKDVHSLFCIFFAFLPWVQGETAVSPEALPAAVGIYVPGTGSSRRSEDAWVPLENGI